MSNTITKFLAEDVRGNGRLFSYCIESSKCDLNWKPNIKGAGRSILEQADEVVKFNHGIASMLRGGEMTFTEEPAITDPKLAANSVMASANDLASALETVDDDILAKPMVLPFGTFPTRVAVGMANGNMIYHWGQTSYIELLDGDKEFRIPPEFVNA